MMNNEVEWMWKETVVVSVAVHSRYLPGWKNTRNSVKVDGLLVDVWNRNLPNARHEFCLRVCGHSSFVVCVLKMLLVFACYRFFPVGKLTQEWS